MAEYFDTVVVGAGQAGLAISYYLTEQKRPHVILEKRGIGEAWRSEKWDSFTLVTPSWTLRLPGFTYAGAKPDGFLTREETVRYLEDYARQFKLPVRLGVEVLSIEGAGDDFTIVTNQGAIEAANVVIATGSFQKPRIPAFASRISPHIRQIHSSQYRNPQELPPGAVLVVGTGQSGCQITEELYQDGRKVYLSTGSTGRAPRHYRGKDIFWWLDKLGFFSRTVDKLPSPVQRFAANPQASGKNGGRSLNLHQFALDGVTLLGRMQDANGSTVSLAGDLKENLARSDKFAAELTKAVDGFIEKTGLQAPEAHDPELSAGYESELITDLDLDSAGITSIIWAAGYAFDYTCVRFPIFDEFGYPVQQRGITAQSGLYFVGLQWLYTGKSSLLLGVGEDAAHIAAHIAERS